MSKAKLRLADPHRQQPAVTGRLLKRTKKIALFLLVASLLHLIAACRANRNALTAKYGPTTYTNLSTKQVEQLTGDHWRYNSNEPNERSIPGYSRQSLLQDRHEWKSLSSGFEGDTFSYEGLVVKVYQPANAPFRNCVPSQDLRWPTEISASLVLSGRSDQLTASDDDSYVPVIDYFLAPGDDEASTWHLVTPFLPGGHLKNLAERLRQSDRTYTARELDIIFRPSFERVLNALDQMHTDHTLCHDDIKQDNIFVADHDPIANQTTHWLVADMGNVRQVDHSYHRSIIWTRNNLRDCRANDVFRLAKTYMKFLSRAVSSELEFNEAFLAGEAAWSRLFWATWHDVQQQQPISASRLLARSRSLDFVPSSPSRPSSFGGWPAELRDPVYWSLMGREKTLARAVREKLFYGATEIPARLWGLTPVLGIPVPDCRT